MGGSTFISLPPSTWIVRAVGPQFVIRILSVAVPPGQTWLVTSPAAFGYQHGGGMSQPHDAVGRLGSSKPPRVRSRAASMASTLSRMPRSSMSTISCVPSASSCCDVDLFALISSPRERIGRPRL